MSEETHFIDTEVKFESLKSWDDYETYCENGQMVFDAICDEAALYKIASEAVKKKLDSLNEFGKFYKQKYDEARDEISSLKKEIVELQKAVDNSKKEIEDSKLVQSKKIYEDYLRSQNPLGVIEGDTFYALKKVYEKVDCPYCGGSGVIKTQTGKEFECGKCNKGKVSVFKNYDIVAIQCVIIIRDGGFFKYIDTYGNVYTTLSQPSYYTKAFKTKEDAEEYLKRLDEG